MNLHPNAVVLLVAATGLAAFAWAGYQRLLEKVFLRGHAIVKKHRGDIEQMPIADIARIRYHYHAVVGFIAVWEFIDKNARALRVDGDAKGVEDLLAGLEKSLAGFSLPDFKRQFDAGGVEETIDVWKSA